jgi:hypothetical protein
MYAQDVHQLPDNFLSQAHPRFMKMAPHVNGAKPESNGIPQFDTLSNWNGSYDVPGFDPNGKLKTHWLYNMVGNPPQNGGTTTINAPVVPVVVQLLNSDGSVAYTYDVTPDVLPVLQSPIFQSATFTRNSTPTQITDAIMRAEFWNTMAPDWHTLLNGSLKTTRTMAVPNGFYYYKLNKNGSCCQYVLIDINELGNLLFPTSPTDTTTPIGAAENAGDITTKDISTFLFPNTYLYFGNPNNCCVGGYHSFDEEPGDISNGNKTEAYVMNYSA